MEDTRVNLLLKEYLQKLKADRALIALFHQGGIGSSDVVFTVMLEELSFNTPSVYPIVKNIPRNIIDIEFKDNLDSIVLGIYKEDLPSKCTEHLKRINVKTIINMLLKFDNYYWGILSFQFKEIPQILMSKEVIQEDLKKQLLFYKKSIHEIVDDYVKNYYDN